MLETVKILCFLLLLTHVSQSDGQRREKKNGGWSIGKNDLTNTFGNSGVSAFAKPDVTFRQGGSAFRSIGPFNISYGSLCKNDQTNTFGNSGVSAFAKPDVNLRRGSPAFTGSVGKKGLTHTFGNSGVSVFAKPDVKLRRGGFDVRGGMAGFTVKWRRRRSLSSLIAQKLLAQ